MSTTTDNKKPTHAIWQVIGEGERQRWNRIGAAWMHRDAKGARLKFDSYPLSGRIVLREIANETAAATSEGGAS